MASAFQGCVEAVTEHLAQCQDQISISSLLCRLCIAFFLPVGEKIAERYFNSFFFFFYATLLLQVRQSYANLLSLTFISGFVHLQSILELLQSPSRYATRLCSSCSLFFSLPPQPQAVRGMGITEKLKISHIKGSLLAVFMLRFTILYLHRE